MAHPWESLVVGGVGRPQFFIVQDNFVTNAYFDEDTSGWTESSGGILTRVEDEDALGGYMGKISYSNDLQYVYWTKDLNADVSGRTWLASFRAKSDQNRTFKAEFFSQINGEVFGTGTFTATTEPDRFVLISTSDQPTQADHTLFLRIYGSSTTGTGLIFFDDVFFSEVDDNIILTQPQQSQLNFEEEVYGQNQLWHGAIQKFGKSYRPQYFASWDFINDADEKSRQDIAEASRVFVMPHNDVNWGFQAIWDGDFLRSYAFDRFFGHRGVVNMRAIELFGQSPQFQVGEGTLVIHDDLIIM